MLRKIIIIFILILSNSRIQSVIGQNAFDFYPLNNGDIFLYNVNVKSIYEDPFYYIETVKVIKDTLLENGNVYKYIITTNNISTDEVEKFERIDSSSGIIFRYANSYHELKIENIFAEVSQYYNTSRFYPFSFIDEFNTIFLSLATDTVLGIQTSVRTFEDLTWTSGDYSFHYSLAEGFGLYTTSSVTMAKSIKTKLIYAKINDKEYGEQLTNVNSYLENIPNSPVLIQNYPNPFNPTTKIFIKNPEKNYINLSIINTLGEVIKIITNKTYSKGEYVFEFNGNGLSSGIYFARLINGRNLQIIKMSLIK